MTTEPQSGYAKIFANRKLQDFWIRRVIAIIIDAILVTIVVYIILSLIFLLVAVSTSTGFLLPWWTTYGLTFPFFSGLPLFLYSAFTESTYGYTLGKRIMYLKVVDKEGKKPSTNSAFLRNVTKIYGLALLLEVLISLAMPNRDPTHRYLDSYAGTTVVSEDGTLLRT